MFSKRRDLKTKFPSSLCYPDIYDNYFKLTKFSPGPPLRELFPSVAFHNTYL